jgi:hypothetical protein
MQPQFTFVAAPVSCPAPPCRPNHDITLSYRSASVCWALARPATAITPTLRQILITAPLLILSLAGSECPFFVAMLTEGYAQPNSWTKKQIHLADSLRSSEKGRLLLPLVWPQDVRTYPPLQLTITLQSTQYLVHQTDNPDCRTGPSTSTAKRVAAAVERAKSGPAATKPQQPCGVLVIAHHGDAAADEIVGWAKTVPGVGDVHAFLTDMPEDRDPVPGAVAWGRLGEAKVRIEEAAVVVLVASDALSRSRAARAVVSHVVRLPPACEQVRRARTPVFPAGPRRLRLSSLFLRGLRGWREWFPGPSRLTPLITPPHTHDAGGRAAQRHGAAAGLRAPGHARLDLPPRRRRLLQVPPPHPLARTTRGAMCARDRSNATSARASTSPRDRMGSVPPPMRIRHTTCARPR